MIIPKLLKNNKFLERIPKTYTQKRTFFMSENKRSCRAKSDVLAERNRAFHINETVRSR